MLPEDLKIDEVLFVKFKEGGGYTGRVLSITTTTAYNPDTIIIQFHENGVTVGHASTDDAWYFSTNALGFGKHEVSEITRI